MAAKPLRAVPDPQYLDSDHEAIVTFASTYFDDDEERETFIDTLMERRGYQRRTAWAPPEPEQEPEPQQPPQQQQSGQRKPNYFKR